MNKAVFDPDAQSEFLAAVEYYEKCQDGLSRRFRLTVESHVVRICEMPFLFRVFHPPFRRCLISQFPYSIIFSVEPNFIMIVAVAHTKRKPGYWNARIKKYKPVLRTIK